MNIYEFATDRNVKHAYMFVFAENETQAVELANEHANDCEFMYIFMASDIISTLEPHEFQKGVFEFIEL